MHSNPLSRRSFLAMAAAAPLLSAAPEGKRIPIGLELFSVRDLLAKDPKGTVTAVAKMGYEVVEFFSPYFGWTTDQAKDMRSLMNDLGIRCLSTHNGPEAFTGSGIAKAIELNGILGGKYIVMASAGRVAPGLDGWKTVAETITKAMRNTAPRGSTPVITITRRSSSRWTENGRSKCWPPILPRM